MSNNAIINIKPLGFLWETSNPFLFCAHHLDDYPAGNLNLGPDASLEGRNLGMDFAIKDGWRMYHGEKIPGFPTHPHRGFETVTVVLKGLIDHSDSLGAAGRYGNGDVQWMTAGAGVQHAEMFPLLNQNGRNPAELFQIWLNLPRARKYCNPYYTMHWAEDIPVFETKDSDGKSVAIKVIAGQLADKTALPPAPDSWANDPANEVAIWLIQLEAHAQFALPLASSDIYRSLYFYEGTTLKVNDTDIPSYHSVALYPDQTSLIQNGDAPASLLLLQGKPINEPVVQNGPFVMNTQEEIRKAYSDYNLTQFGGWPWPRYDMVHPREKGRFARYGDGRVESPVEH